MTLEIADREKAWIINNPGTIGEHLGQVLPLLMIKIKQRLEFLMQFLFHVEVSLCRPALSNIRSALPSATSC
jgi:hypothetical protein